MINIREAVETIVNGDYDAREGLERGIVNLSQYARTIQKEVADYTKKDVGIQSIVVTLARLEKKLIKQKKTGDIAITQLSVQSPIVQLVYPKNRDTLESLVGAIHNTSGLDDVFFSFSTSTKDIALVVSEKLEQEVAGNFAVPAVVQKRGLSAISIRFNEQLVAAPNVGLVLLKKIASRNIVLDAALTTYNEFTLIFETRFLHDAIEALSPQQLRK